MERRSKRRARAFAEGKGKREEKSKRREVATKRWRGSTALFVVVDYLLVFCTRVLFTLKAGVDGEWTLSWRRLRNALRLSRLPALP
ncbi:cyclic nucleotide-gated ion channel [Musa troglodytarum]|uniref:Cyclic nucleotide-gated ion channel n=1 Tax=Musa troglodytarum TaxID=320322 RepID=A0A9E7KYR8_9LILI|nr:cyclic nucleotide-gated ion channel [Musa troglodytarum]URE37387.1 cyclic nucleotide-gated ion channel [Musa troglodytarum]